MKQYRVELAKEAEKNIQAIHGWLCENAGKVVADKWYGGLDESIAKLRAMPHSWPLAPESEKLGEEIRHLLYGPSGRKYRVLFQVNAEEDSVNVLFVRHWAQDWIVDQE